MTEAPPAAPSAPSPLPSRAAAANLASLQARYMPPPDIETLDGKTAMEAFNRLRKIALTQSWVIAALAIVFLFMVPLSKPLFTYYAITPDHKTKRLVGLDMANLTNRAVLSWATSSITEIMTMGFGDMDYKVPKQKWRFTPDGWDSYVTTFVRMRIGETFKQSRLVLTTVPSNTPVILWQGLNKDQAYEWIVQMPVIMTYATNNNVTKQQSEIVTLTLVRVPSSVNSLGIAIQSWVLG